jgi:outer membrane receptor for ferrienterochelin and colicin
MSQRNTRSARICGTLVAVPLLISVALSARAQQKTPDPIVADAAGTRLEEIIVTGSRIARPDLERLQPTTVISARTLDDRGYTDVGEALNELPGFGVPPASSANTQSSFGIAQSFVDLYSLGSQRTLTLVNGRRFVSSNTPSLNGPTNPGQQVDLNVIPTKLIERIETISVGGAPIYGADAISGTVNIILKKDFSGLDLDAQVGTSSRSDASSARARALWGRILRATVAT